MGSPRLGTGVSRGRVRPYELPLSDFKGRRAFTGGPEEARSST